MQNTDSCTVKRFTVKTDADDYVEDLVDVVTKTLGRPPQLAIMKSTDSCTVKNFTIKTDADDDKGYVTRDDVEDLVDVVTKTLGVEFELDKVIVYDGCFVGGYMRYESAVLKDGATIFFYYPFDRLAIKKLSDDAGNVFDFSLDNRDQNLHKTLKSFSIVHDASKTLESFSTMHDASITGFERCKYADAFFTEGVSDLAISAAKILYCNKRCVEIDDYFELRAFYGVGGWDRTYVLKIRNSETGTISVMRLLGNGVEDFGECFFGGVRAGDGSWVGYDECKKPESLKRLVRGMKTVAVYESSGTEDSPTLNCMCTFCVFRRAWQRLIKAERPSAKTINKYVNPTIYALKTEDRQIIAKIAGFLNEFRLSGDDLDKFFNSVWDLLPFVIQSKLTRGLQDYHAAKPDKECKPLKKISASAIRSCWVSLRKADSNVKLDMIRHLYGDYAGDRSAVDVFTRSLKGERVVLDREDDLAGWKELRPLLPKNLLPILDSVFLSSEDAEKKRKVLQAERDEIFAQIKAIDDEQHNVQKKIKAERFREKQVNKAIQSLIARTAADAVAAVVAKARDADSKLAKEREERAAHIRRLNALAGIRSAQAVSRTAERKAEAKTEALKVAKEAAKMEEEEAKARKKASQAEASSKKKEERKAYKAAKKAAINDCTKPVATASKSAVVSIVRSAPRKPPSSKSVALPAASPPEWKQMLPDATPPPPQASLVPPVAPLPEWKQMLANAKAQAVPASPSASSTSSLTISTAHSSLDEAASLDECCVCMEQISARREVALAPCGHTAFCISCAESIAKKGNCPICAAPVACAVRLYW